MSRTTRRPMTCAGAGSVVPLTTREFIAAALPPRTCPACGRALYLNLKRDNDEHGPHARIPYHTAPDTEAKAWDAAAPSQDASRPRAAPRLLTPLEAPLAHALLAAWDAVTYGP